MHTAAEIADEPKRGDPPEVAVAEISPLVELADQRPYRTILQLALPVFVEQALIFGVDLTDAYLSGRLSEAATEAICVAGYIGWMATVMFGLIGIGTTALVARAWGAGGRDEACRIAGRSLLLAPCLALPVFCLLQILAPAVAEFLNLRGEALPIAVEYLRYDAFGHVCTSLIMIGGAALRGSGDMRTPMLVLLVVNVINIFVSTATVFGFGPFPHLGVFGIVTGTVAAKVIGAGLMLAVLTGGWSHLRVRLRDLRFDSDITRRLLRIGGPACLDGMVTVTGHLMFLRVISLVKDHQPGALAAHLVGVRVEAVSYLPATAWGIAAASLVGQALGAHRPELAVRIGHAAAKQAFLYALVVGLIMFASANQVFAAMHTDPNVIAAGVPALRTLAFYSIPNAALIVYVNCLRGAGDTRFPLLFAMIGVWLVRVPLAYQFGYLQQGGLVGAWIGMGADLCLRSVLMYWRFSAARWTRIRV
jgi:putative MATE family efflux protein